MKPIRLQAMCNLLRGYLYDPVQKYRCCFHVTPEHYSGCPMRRATELRKKHGR